MDNPFVATLRSALRSNTPILMGELRDVEASESL